VEQTMEKIKESGVYPMGFQALTFRKIFLLYLWEVLILIGCVSIIWGIYGYETALYSVIVLGVFVAIGGIAYSESWWAFSKELTYQWIKDPSSDLAKERELENKIKGLSAELLQLDKKFQEDIDISMNLSLKSEAISTLNLEESSKESQIGNAIQGYLKLKQSFGFDFVRGAKELNAKLEELNLIIEGISDELGSIAGKEFSELEANFDELENRELCQPTCEKVRVKQQQINIRFVRVVSNMNRFVTLSSSTNKAFSKFGKVSEVFEQIENELSTIKAGKS